MLWLLSDSGVWEPRLALESRGRWLGDSSWVRLSQVSVSSLRALTESQHVNIEADKVLSIYYLSVSLNSLSLVSTVRFMLFKLLEIDVSGCWIVYVKLQYLEWLCNGWLLFLLPIRSKCDIIQSHMSFSSNSQTQLNILFFPHFSLKLQFVSWDRPVKSVSPMTKFSSRRHGRHYYCI